MTHRSTALRNAGKISGHRTTTRFSQLHQLASKLRMPPNLLLHLKKNRIDYAYVLAQIYKKLPSNHLC